MNRLLPLLADCGYCCYLRCWSTAEVCGCCLVMMSLTMSNARHVLQVKCAIGVVRGKRKCFDKRIDKGCWKGVQMWRVCWKGLVCYLFSSTLLENLSSRPSTNCSNCSRRHGLCMLRGNEKRVYNSIDNSEGWGERVTVVVVMVVSRQW